MVDIHSAGVFVKAHIVLYSVPWSWTLEYVKLSCIATSKDFHTDITHQTDHNDTPLNVIYGVRSGDYHSNPGSCLMILQGFIVAYKLSYKPI